MITISFLNNKGGVAKTATVTSVGHIMATVFGKKVLLADLDPQANTSQILGFDLGQNEVSLKELMERKVYPIENTVEDILLTTEKDIHDCIYNTEYENLDIIPSYLTLSNVENQLIGKVDEPQQFRLWKQLEKVKEEYDFCLIDCGPNVSLLNVNALAASDYLFVPSACSKSARFGIANVWHLMQNVQNFTMKQLVFGGCFLVQFDPRKKICKEAWEDCKDALGEKLLDITIPVDTKVEQMASFQKPICAVNPNARATQSYLQLTKKILEIAV